MSEENQNEMTKIVLDKDEYDDFKKYRDQMKTKLKKKKSEQKEVKENRNENMLNEDEQHFVNIGLFKVNSKEYLQIIKDMAKKFVAMDKNEEQFIERYGPWVENIDKYLPNIKQLSKIVEKPPEINEQSTNEQQPEEELNEEEKEVKWIKEMQLINLDDDAQIFPYDINEDHSILGKDGYVPQIHKVDSKRIKLIPEQMPANNLNTFDRLDIDHFMTRLVIGGRRDIETIKNHYSAKLNTTCLEIFIKVPSVRYLDKQSSVRQNETKKILLFIKNKKAIVTEIPAKIKEKYAYKKEGDRRTYEYPIYQNKQKLYHIKLYDGSKPTIQYDDEITVLDGGLYRRTYHENTFYDLDDIRGNYDQLLHEILPLVNEKYKYLLNTNFTSYFKDSGEFIKHQQKWKVQRYIIFILRKALDVNILDSGAIMNDRDLYEEDKVKLTQLMVNVNKLIDAHKYKHDHKSFEEIYMGIVRNESNEPIFNPENSYIPEPKGLTRRQTTGMLTLYKPTPPDLFQFVPQEDTVDSLGVTTPRLSEYERQKDNIIEANRIYERQKQENSFTHPNELTNDDKSTAQSNGANMIDDILSKNQRHIPSDESLIRPQGSLINDKYFNYTPK